MKATYGVIWQNGGLLHAGKLELASSAIRLEGAAAAGESVVEEFPFRELAGVHIARAGADRLEGLPTLVLERANGDSVRIASVAQGGIVYELAEKLSSIKLEAVAGSRRVAIVVPFKSEHRAAVQQLVEQGPPFDPELMALERHDVFVTDREAIFLFEGPDGGHVVERIIAQPGLWRGALAWRKYLDGQPRVARQAYTWSHASLD
jgi:hypothetical protein